MCIRSKTFFISVPLIFIIYAHLCIESISLEAVLHSKMNMSYLISTHFTYCLKDMSMSGFFNDKYLCLHQDKHFCIFWEKAFRYKFAWIEGGTINMSSTSYFKKLLQISALIKITFISKETLLIVFMYVCKFGLA